MDDNLFIEYINSPYEEPQDMLPKIDETMLTDMESSLETCLLYTSDAADEL